MAVGDAALMRKLIPGRLAGGRAAELVGGGPTVPHREREHAFPLCVLLDLSSDGPDDS